MSDSSASHKQPKMSDHGEPNAKWQTLGVRLGLDGLRTPRQRQHSRALDIESIVAGKVVRTPNGSCFVLETRYPLEHLHGETRLSALRPDGSPSPGLARLAGDERVSGLDFRSAIFFDIETTGLGIGAGLVAFLVGFGFFEGDEFCLRQYFMRDYSEEQAMLDLLSRQMRDLRWWVSFNGRNFDLPVLQARFICNRYRMPLSEAPHLDLLYPARRLWRKRLKSCRLSALEANLLGLGRESDVPGWLIPDLYFDYLRYGEAGPLHKVFVHNALDVLSLVVLAAKADQMLRDPFGPAAQHGADLYSLGRICESWRDLDRARIAYEQALQDRLPPALQREALHRLSMLYKRIGQIERAIPIWQNLREQGSVEACVELAKHFEHHHKDAVAAAKLTGEALALPNLARSGQCSPEALSARLARLRRKLGDGGLPMPHIESYSFGKISVDGRTHTSDLIILPGAVRPGWWRKEGHRLDKDDLEEIIEAAPDVLVIGTGNVGLMEVPQETLEYLAEHDIRTVVERTAAACQRYNELAEQEQAAAALHLTC
jgi:uncharacterized protein YprB with RNaseH-like and TPR domain